MNTLAATPSFAKTEHRLGLYPVVDNLELLRNLLGLGVSAIQLRIKNLSGDAVERAVAGAIEINRRFNARLFINDYWQLAAKHGAYGVHLGQEDLETADLPAIRAAGLRLGISTHDDFETARAAALRPSYIALGHIFPTQTKAMPSAPQGLETLKRRVRELKDFPTVAIGGISVARVPAVLETGVGGIAVVSAISGARDWREATKTLLRLIEKRDFSDV